MPPITEWTKDHTVEVDGRTYARPVMVGGVDFTRAALQHVSRRDFKARWPKLARQVKQALPSPTAAAQSGGILLGGDNLAR